MELKEAPSLTNFTFERFALATFYGVTGNSTNPRAECVLGQKELNWDPGMAVILAPSGTFCFTLQEFERSSTYIDGQLFVATKPVIRDIEKFYIGSNEVYSVDEMLKLYEDDPRRQEMIQELRKLGWEKFYKTSCGHWCQISDKDQFLG